MKKKNRVILLHVVLILIGTFCLWRPLISAEEVKTPIIHAEKSIHTFPTVFEGEKLTYSFIISNRGTADLEIKKVTHS